MGNTMTLSSHLGNNCTNNLFDIYNCFGNVESIEGLQLPGEDLRLLNYVNFSSFQVLPQYCYPFHTPSLMAGSIHTQPGSQSGRKYCYPPNIGELCYFHWLLLWIQESGCYCFCPSPLQWNYLLLWLKWLPGNLKGQYPSLLLIHFIFIPLLGFTCENLGRSIAATYWENIRKWPHI